MGRPKFTPKTVPFPSMIGFGFTFLVLAQPGSPRQNPEGRKTVVVTADQTILMVQIDPLIGPVSVE